MTKPNKFIMNSDYLPLAQTSKTDFTAYFLTAQVTGGQPYDKYVDFTVPSSPGAVDIMEMKYNDNGFCLGNQIIVETTGTMDFIIWVTRVNSTTMRVNLHVYTSSPSGYTLPNTTVQVKLSSFKPPNVF